MNAIETIQDQVISEFELFDEWDEKYGYIIEIGKKLTPMPDQYKVQENIIRGCQSTVWLASEYKNGLVTYYAESDAIIVKGLVSLLIKVYSNQEPKDIISTEPYFIESIGMKQHLSMTRSNGLSAMVKQMKIEALAYMN
ncbi:MAG: SufE family protein [Cytophagales bacterium]|nr:MAG: SufE family protein [Cytophagales bacterium]